MATFEDQLKALEAFSDALEMLEYAKESVQTEIDFYCVKRNIIETIGQKAKNIKSNEEILGFAELLAKALKMNHKDPSSLLELQG